jgi:hypothetical protein
MAVTVTIPAAKIRHRSTSRPVCCTDARIPQERKQMKRYLLAATALALSAAGAFAQNPGTGVTTAMPAMPANPSMDSSGGYLFPNEADEPMAPPTGAPTQESGRFSHIFLFPPAENGEAASG